MSDYLCETCKFAIYDNDEKGWYPDDCKKNYPYQRENEWHEVIECNEYEEAKDGTN